MQTIPEISTTRLKLRPFLPSDAKEIQRQAGNPKIAEMTGTVPHPYLDGMAESWMGLHAGWFQDKKQVTWAIEVQATQKLVGCISFGLNQEHQRAEMGYWMGEEFWGNGYCTEAAIAGIEYVFEKCEMNKITSRYKSINPASGRIMIKAGMKQEGVLRDDFHREGKFLDIVVYGLLKREWRKP